MNRMLVVGCVLLGAVAAGLASDLTPAEEKGVQTVVNRHIRRESAESEGVFVLHDEKLDKDWNLKQVGPKPRSIARTSDNLVTACVDFRQTDGKKKLDVDFLLNRTDSGWTVRQVVIHSVDGQVRGGKISAPALRAPEVKATYVCPMGDYSGPNTPDGRCPKCGMDLQKQ